MEQPQVHIISKETYKTLMSTKVGTLLFGDQFYEITDFCNKKELKKQFKLKKTIKKVLISTIQYPHFKNAVNKEIQLEQPMFCKRGQELSYEVHGYPVSKHFLGDCWIVE